MHKTTSATAAEDSPAPWLLRALGAALAYLWSGWGAVASLLLFAALWEAAAQRYGSLILPGPREAITTLVALLQSGVAQPELLTSARRALGGLALAIGVGSVAGLAAGLSMTTAMVSRPLVTLLIGTPPIAWLVLAMLWFGMGDATAVFTVFIACLPLVFAAGLQGARTLDGQLHELARAYRLPRRMALTDVVLPHVLSYLFPAWITALGTAWKVVVMAELLSTRDGIGAALAVSRAQLDTATSMAWIVAVIGLLLAVEYLMLEPIKRQLERWRTA